MKYLSFILLFLVMLSCKKDRLNINVSDVDITLNVNRFDKVFFEKNAGDLHKIIDDEYASHSAFIDLYSEEIIRVGPYGTELFDTNLNAFINDTIYSRVGDSVLFVFSNFTKIEKGLQDGFKHYKHYYPDKLVPEIYTYVSGFNQSLLVAQNFIGISLDKYLGKDCIFYRYLGIPKYKMENMQSSKIVPDVFYAWALTEFQYADSSDNLLANMIYQGKLMYFVEAMLPKVDDAILIGYTNDQYKWCQKNEALMWAYLIEKKLLYSEERLNLQTFIGDSPFTKSFSMDSPGRTGVWLGWQIVRSYMNSHEEVSLQQLMNMNNAQQILTNSNYFPD